MKRPHRFGFAAAVILVAGAAHAQDREQDAERLFQEGQKLLAERRYGEACPKLEAAYKKDLQLGTLLNLAYCHKELGLVWQAWLEFREAELKAAELKMKERKDFATKSKNELEKSLTKVVVDVPPKIELTEVLVEERRVPEAEHGQVFAVEPNGQRKFTFRAKGKKQATSLVVVGKSDKPQHVAVPEMEDETESSAAAPTSDATPTASSSAPPPRAAEQPASDGSRQRLVAYGLFGVAAVGIGIGTFTGLKALNSPCTDKPGDPRSADPAVQAEYDRNLSAFRERCPDERHDEDTTSANIATASFITAGVAVAAGVVLYLLAPGSSTSATARVRPTFGLGPASGWAGIHGRF